MAAGTRIALAVIALAVAYPQAAQAVGTKLTAVLSGAGEPFAGDPKGGAVFTASVDIDAGELCYTLKGTALGPLLTAHVSAGDLGAEGPPLVTVDLAENECRAVDPAVLGRIVAAPASYYINVYPADHPRGAVRGQLQLAQ